MYFCVLCIVCFVSFSVLFVCICVLNNCHRVATQLQLTNIYHIIYHIIFYIDQTGRSIGIRHREHIRYIKTNNTISADTLHILNIKRENGNADETIQLPRPCNKGNERKCWESFYIHLFQEQNTLIDEQKVIDLSHYTP
jgi:hypothetical protein